MGKSLLFSLIFSMGVSLAVKAQKLADEPRRCAKTGLVLSDQDQKTKKTRKKERWLTALYLRLDKVSKSDRADWPLVPALLLETSPTLSVKTGQGPKTVGKLRKGDVLYRYEADTQQLTTWRVGIVHRKARKMDASYSLAIVGGTSLTENRIALKK